MVYGEQAMRHLKEIGTVVYLELSCEEIRKRLGDLRKRGVALKEGQTLEALYAERVPLYEKYADVTLCCGGKRMRQIVSELSAVFQPEGE